MSQKTMALTSSPATIFIKLSPEERIALTMIPAIMRLEEAIPPPFLEMRMTTTRVRKAKTRLRNAPG